MAPFRASTAKVVGLNALRLVCDDIVTADLYEIRTHRPKDLATFGNKNRVTSYCFQWAIRGCHLFDHSATPPRHSLRKELREKP